MTRISTSGARPTGLTTLLLAGLGAALIGVTVAAAVALQRLSNDGYVATHLVHGLLYGLGVAIILRRPLGRSGLLVILAVALALRLIALLVPPTLTTDAFRYVWDGRVQAAGINPYLYVPADERLAHLRDDAIYPNINRKETHPTIYPPVAEMAFLLGTRLTNSIRGQQIVMLAFDLVTIGALVLWLTASGLPRERVAIYAWHPLTVWEFAGMAHIDSVAVAGLTLACLAGARGRQVLAGIALAAAGLVKYHYLLFLPALWRRWHWGVGLAMAVTVVALYAPYLSAGTKLAGSLVTHLGEEGYQDGYGFYLVGMPRHLGLPYLAPAVFAGLAALALGAAGLAAMLRPNPQEISPSWLIGLGALFLVLVSPHYPWYYTMVLPLLCRRVSLPLLWITLVVSLVYLERPGGLLEPFTRIKVFTAMFGGFAVLAFGEWWLRKRAILPPWRP